MSSSGRTASSSDGSDRSVKVGDNVAEASVATVGALEVDSSSSLANPRARRDGSPFCTCSCGGPGSEWDT